MYDLENNAFGTFGNKTNTGNDGGEFFCGKGKNYKHESEREGNDCRNEAYSSRCRVLNYSEYLVMLLEDRSAPDPEKPDDYQVNSEKSG